MGLPIWTPEPDRGGVCARDRASDTDLAERVGSRAGRRGRVLRRDPAVRAGLVVEAERREVDADAAVNPHGTCRAERVAGAIPHHGRTVVAVVEGIAGAVVPGAGLTGRMAKHGPIGVPALQLSRAVGTARG